eukprot:m.52006 g.52006  ORF g.52006 m.52006 type:complete len:71 (-) comp7595_c0_seq4:441-653(-)
MQQTGELCDKKKKKRITKPLRRVVQQTTHHEASSGIASATSTESISANVSKLYGEAMISSIFISDEESRV